MSGVPRYRFPQALWLVERDGAHVELIDRVGAEWSGFRIADGLDAKLELPAVGVDLPLAEIYADVL